LGKVAVPGRPGTSPVSASTGGGEPAQETPTRRNATLELFSTLYGVEAGNLALKCLPTRIFIGGGIAPKILPVLQGGSFMRGFTDKGRFSEFMKEIEVSVALNPAAPLIGAAHYALAM
jgi:glucokinase